MEAYLENVCLQQAEDCTMFICFRTIKEALGRAQDKR